jgi:hypothetical protein
MSDANKRIARRLLEELFEHGNLAAADELVHPETLPDNPQGPEGLKETVTWLRGVWGPIRAEMEDEIAEEVRVVARVTMHGRHLDEFLGKPPTGKQFAVEHIHICRIADGSLVGPRRPRPGSPARADRWLATLGARG